MEPEPTAPVAPPSTSGKRLSPIEWEQIVILWESGSCTLQELADRFSISKPSMHQGLAKRKAVKGSRAKEFARTTEDELKSDAQRKGEEIRDFKGKYQRFGDYILQSAIVELQDLRKKPRADRTREENARIFTSIKYTAEVYGIVRDNKFHLYDLYAEQDQGDELPDIGVTEYTPEEIEMIRNKTAMPLLEEDDPIIEGALETLAEMEAPKAE